MGKDGERIERKGKNDYTTLCFYIGHFVDNAKKTIRTTLKQA